MSTSTSSARPRCCPCSWDEPLVPWMHLTPPGWALLSRSCHALLLSLHKDAGEVNFLKHVSNYITCWLKFFSTLQAIPSWGPSTQWWAEASADLAASLLAPPPAAHATPGLLLQLHGLYCSCLELSLCCSSGLVSLPLPLLLTL